ncbi:MAG TPA: hypothetical protein VEC18_04080, partial [Myxococcota bacterium]|nr:hypothetical protein [Myxococcota bacterium]
MRRHALAIVAGIALSGAAHAAVELRTLGGPDDPLRAECERCAEGDYFLDNGALEIAVGASHRRDESFYRFATADAYGSIVFCRPRGSTARGDAMLGTPYLRIGNTTHHLVYEEVRVDDVGVGHPTPRARIRASVERELGGGARVRFEVRYEIEDASPRIGVRLRATNVGSRTLDGLIYALFFDPHQIYDFSPADHAAHRALAFRGYPRASHLLAWIDPTPRVAASEDRYGWDGGMLLPDPVSIRLEPGASDERHYALVAGSDSATVLARAYRELAVTSHRVMLEPESASRDFYEVAIREAGSQSIFYRAFRDRPEPLAIELPAGAYVARANFFPGVDECSFTVPSAGGRACALRDPPLGRARFRIVDGAGRFVPGKLSFHGIEETRSPYFRPVNPAYDDGYWESYKNSVYPERGGSEVALPVGRYRVVASRGPEYAIDERIVEIDAERVEDLALRIERAIDRSDLISMDSHLHTLESDGSVDIAAKVRAIVAEGVEVAIATDHNFPVDYRPALAALGLEGELIAFTGAEVTVPERLDYNTYPMQLCTEPPIATCPRLGGAGAG